MNKKQLMVAWVKGASERLKDEFLSFGDTYLISQNKDLIKVCATELPINYA